MASSPLIASLQAGGLDYLLPYLNLEDCIRLACSSRTARAAVQLQLSTRNKYAARQLLLDRIQRTADDSVLGAFGNLYGDLQPYAAVQQQISWLVQQAGPLRRFVSNSDHAEQCMRIQRVPVTVAIALVQQGFRFTYQQLITAAQQQVQGLEVWTQAYRHLDVPRPDGMPQLVEALCCNDKWVSPAVSTDGLPVETSTNILKLAVVMPAVSTATNIVDDICSSGAADDLDARDVANLLLAAIKGSHSPRVEILVKLPGAQSIEPCQLLPLIQAALTSKLTYSLQLLCKLPGAQSIAVEQIAPLLQQAVQIGSPGAVEVLCGFPAAAQLSLWVVDYLMQRVGAGGVGMCGRVWALTQLPDAFHDQGAFGAF